MSLAFLVEEVAAAWLALTGSGEAIREGLAVVGQHCLDIEGSLLFHSLHERSRVLRRLAAPDFQIQLALRSNEGHVQVAFFCCSRGI